MSIQITSNPFPVTFNDLDGVQKYALLDTLTWSGTHELQSFDSLLTSGYTMFEIEMTTAMGSTGTCTVLVNDIATANYDYKTGTTITSNRNYFTFYDSYPGCNKYRFMQYDATTMKMWSYFSADIGLTYYETLKCDGLTSDLDKISFDPSANTTLIIKLYGVR